MDICSISSANQSNAYSLFITVESNDNFIFDSKFHVDLCENENEFIVINRSLDVEKGDISTIFIYLEILVIKIGWTHRSREKELRVHVTDASTNSATCTWVIYLLISVKLDGTKISFKNDIMRSSCKMKNAGGANINIKWIRFQLIVLYVL